jgi:hypothetical protein
MNELASSNLFYDQISTAKYTGESIEKNHTSLPDLEKFSIGLILAKKQIESLAGTI